MGPLRPLLRTAKLAVIRRHAERLARTPCPDESAPLPPPPGFIVACGRSGTTILGKLFAPHPEIAYLREPYHFWAQVDRRCDVTNLHYRVRGLWFMDAEHRSDRAQLVFNRLVMGERARAGKPMVVEKTPHNIARIGFLESLAPGARYVHIVRNGIDVCRSIEQLATEQPYRMAFRSHYNQWWGEDGAKWRALSEEGPPRGYFADGVSRLATDAQRGAYEWLTSLGEADRWRDRLGERILEVRYPDLTADPRVWLARLCAHFGVDAPNEWLESVVKLVGPERVRTRTPIALPPEMATTFNEYQGRYGFEGRAEPIAVAEVAR
ncbi:MAG: sulfotransferase [Phycisphaeraceae bacterium]|nr:sulfotransferase [Phycisphaeraceae bacterium]